MLNSKTAWYISGVSNRNRLDSKHLIYVYYIANYEVWTLQISHRIRVRHVSDTNTPWTLSNTRWTRHLACPFFIIFVSSDTLGYVTDTRGQGQGHVCMCFYDNQK